MFPAARIYMNIRNCGKKVEAGIDIDLALSETK